MKLTGCSQMIYHRAIALHYSRRSYFTQDIPCRIYQAGILSPGVKINVFFMSLEAGTRSAFCRLISLCIFHCCCFSCFNGRRVPAIIANNSCSFNAKLKLVCAAVHGKAQQAAKFECYVLSNEKSCEPFHLLVCVIEGVKEPVQKQGLIRRTWKMPTLE